MESRTRPNPEEPKPAVPSSPGNGPIPPAVISRKDLFAAAAIQGLLASGEKGTMEVVSKAMNIAKQASEFNFEA